jgi:hypothetical protein
LNGVCVFKVLALIRQFFRAEERAAN